MLSFWQLFLKHSFRKRDLQALQRTIRENAGTLGPELEEGFEKDIPILEVPLPETLEISVQWALGESPGFTLKRSFFEFLFGPPRIYVADPIPGALFGKPVLMAIFYGFGYRKRYLAWGKSYPVVDNEFVPMLLPEPTMAMAIQGLAAYQSIWKGVIPGGTPPAGGFTAGPLTGSFPGADRPNPGGNAPRPPTTPPAPIPAGTTSSTRAFFYGLCFQHPSFNTNGRANDRLWSVTKEITYAFLSRCYRSAFALAGVQDVTSTTRADTFEEMMRSLQKDIAAIKPAFGTQSTDQMVIFVAAHGWGADSQNSGDAAMIYQAGRQHTFIPYAEFFTRLAAIPEIAAHRDKVVLILFSCRSGRIWEGGVVPGELAGMPILTSTQTGGFLSFLDTFEDWITGGLTGNGNLPNTWEEFIDQFKWLGRTQVGGPGPNTPPGKYHPVQPAKNGAIGGCRVQISLESIRYSGPDVGSNWHFDTQVTGATSYINHNGSTINVTPHGRQVGTDIDPLTQGNTRTFNPPAKVYDRLWGPCASNNSVNLALGITGRQSSGNVAMGGGAQNLQFICDNGTTVPQQSVSVNVVQTAPPNTPSLLDAKFSVQVSCT